MTIERIFTLSRSELNNYPLFVRSTKLTEELGEFSEALLHKMGYLPHKSMKEPIEGEAADVILCLLDTLSCAYPEKSSSELMAMLDAEIHRKCDKWQKTMQDRQNR